MVYFNHCILKAKKSSKLVVCLFFVFILSNKSYSQQFNNWYFIANNGLTFNTTPPSFLLGSPFSGLNNTFGSATISDNNGNRLFSSDGVQVWDKNNNQMPNGYGLRGEFCNINGILIIPIINDTSKYYLFTSQGLIFSQSPDTSFYRYSIVDMNANGGLGDVITKNVLIQNQAAEKMVAIPNANGTDIWWVCRDWTNHFYSYKIGCNGFINSNPIVSTIGNNINNNHDNLFGDIKASANGKLIAVAFRTYFEIYQFDNTTGLLSKPIIIKNLNEVYGVEFSPDSKVLYITQRLDDLSFGGITQYDLSIYDSAAIENSRVLIANISETGLQLGPDKKIYAPFGFSLNVIHNPNTLGTACNFQPNILTFPNFTYRRMPYAPPFLFTNQNVQATYTVASDCRTVTLKAKTYIKGNNLAFKWKFGDGDSSLQNIPSGGDTTYTTLVHTYPPGVDTFFASLSVTSDTVCGLGRAGARVVVKPPPPVAKFGFTVGNCGSTTVQFTDSSLLNFNPSLSYQWAYKRAAATGGFTDFSTAANPIFTFAAIDSFEVRLTVTSSLSCVNDNRITKRIYLTPAPFAAFTTSDTCTGSTIRLQNNSTGNIASYQWLFGNGDSSTAALPVYAYPSPGNYTIRLSIVTANNCTASATKTITINPKPAAAFTITESCPGKAISIVNNSTGSIGSYNWVASNGLSFTGSNPGILFNIEGNYSLQLKVQSVFGCSDSIRKPITINAVKISANADTSILINQPLQLSANGAANYVWQPAALLNNPAIGNPVFKTANSGLYPILVQGTTLQGCKGTAALNITVYNSNTGLLIHNAFTPNGDRVNDVFSFTCAGLQSLSYFRVFNRYGQAVYEQRNCGNSLGWDGTYKGVLQNTAAYIYSWQGVTFDGKIVKGTGTVTLIR